eukprot:jgi/Bigna1/90035/estExt_fgenesh1_pg.C_600105
MLFAIAFWLFRIAEGSVSRRENSPLISTISVFNSKTIMAAVRLGIPIHVRTKCTEEEHEAGGGGGGSGTAAKTTTPPPSLMSALFLNGLRQNERGIPMFGVMGVSVIVQEHLQIPTDGRKPGKEEMISSTKAFLRMVYIPILLMASVKLLSPEIYFEMVGLVDALKTDVTLPLVQLLNWWEGMTHFCFAMMCIAAAQGPLGTQRKAIHDIHFSNMRSLSKSLSKIRYGVMPYSMMMGYGGYKIGPFVRDTATKYALWGLASVYFFASILVLYGPFKPNNPKDVSKKQ